MTTKNISSTLGLSGGTLTGRLILNANSSTSLQAATKADADAVTFPTAAVKADVIASTSNTKYVTPAVQKFHQTSVRGYASVLCSGTNNYTIYSSYGVTSISSGTWSPWGAGHLITLSDSIPGYQTTDAGPSVFVQLEYPNTGNVVMGGYIYTGSGANTFVLCITTYNGPAVLSPYKFRFICYAVCA